MTDQTATFTTGDFALASTPTLESPGRYTLRVPDGWQQGRGAFGGLVLAALSRAILDAEPEKDRTLRSFNAEIAGPTLVGDALIEVTALRRGSGLSSYTATLSQNGQGLVHASSVVARARNTDPPRLHIPPPERKSPADAPAMPADAGPSFVPVFVKNLEMRPLGPLPFSGAAAPVASGWVKTRVPTPTFGAPEAIALADAFWPSAFASAPAPRPIGTVAFALQYFPPTPAHNPEDPLYYRGWVAAEQDGYMMEFRELWTEDGRLVALNQQTIAWIR
ncbi:MAG: thioesterase family protein [Polyangiaceae bacterium]